LGIDVALIARIEAFCVEVGRLNPRPAIAPALFKTSMPPTSTTVRCVIVDDHQLLLDLLVGAVSRIPGMEVTATATDVAEAERLAALGGIDLLIVDRQLRTGDGMDVVRTVSARHPGMKCIVIAGITSDFICPSDLLEVIVAVIDKTEASETLLGEIERVMKLPPPDEAPALNTGKLRAQLTARQWELFVALGEGLSNKELAKNLGISTRTVETHRKEIARKLGVSGAALVRLAVLQHRPSERPFPQLTEVENAVRAGGHDA